MGRNKHREPGARPPANHQSAGIRHRSGSAQFELLLPPRQPSTAAEDRESRIAITMGVARESWRGATDSLTRRQLTIPRAEGRRGWRSDCISCPVSLYPRRTAQDRTVSERD